MKEIPNNHLGLTKPVVHHGINYQAQLESRISEASTVYVSFQEGKLSGHLRFFEAPDDFRRSQTGDQVEAWNCDKVTWL